MAIAPPLDADFMTGPSKTPSTFKFSDAPYAPFSKGDKLGKAADWAAETLPKAPRSTFSRGFRDPYFAYGAASSSVFTAETPDVNFSIVDKQAPKPKQPAVLKRRATGAPTKAPTPTAAANRRPYWQQERKIREPSVVIGTDWTLVQSNQFTDFSKLHYEVAAGKPVAKAGSVHTFDKKVETGLKQLKKPAPTYNVTTSEDPIIDRLRKEKQAEVFATDKILALIMSATRTSLPWDLIITKKDGQIVFDKRDGAMELLSVDENSSNPPQDTSEIKINTPDSLSVEATYVNDQFASSSILPEKVALGEKNPFGDEDDLKGYVYNKFSLESDPEQPAINLIVRSEIDAISDDQPTILRALNEYRAPLEWKDGWRDRRGAILGSELRNNLSKIAQWTCQAHLAGARLRLGFMTRTNAKDRSNHELVGVLNRDVSALATDLGLLFDNGWGIVRSIVNIALASEDGKYVLLRDPNAPALRFYRAPN